ncbi:MAG: T9SS type A sorting domain-containing protein [Ignavibacteriaceae bacterium]|nr:T9SS type A sorting domain-containing protein [Ignavibacteriaceae bacterium]
MKKALFILIPSLVLLTVAVSVTGRSFRVTQVPNGSKFSCATCHVSVQGGDDRNQFGLEVQGGFLNGNGDVVWGPALAALDSDNDGFSNGVELQDPNGAWTSGQPNPGVFADVTNPGDPNSKPNPTSVHDGNTNLQDYRLENNYPNPFNPSTKIRFSLPEASDVKVLVFNASGEQVFELVNGFHNAGAYEVEFTAVNLTSGIYFYTLEAGSVKLIKKMTLLK